MRTPASFLLPQSSTVPVAGDGTRVESLGFGTWAWGNKLLWGYDPDADATLQAAFDSVLTPSGPLDRRRFFFDTGDSCATASDRSVTILLCELHHRPSCGPRLTWQMAPVPSRAVRRSFSARFGGNPHGRNELCWAQSLPCIQIASLADRLRRRAGRHCVGWAVTRSRLRRRTGAPPTSSHGRSQHCGMAWRAATRPACAMPSAPRISARSSSARSTATGASVACRTLSTRCS